MSLKIVKKLLLICGIGLALIACQKEVDNQDLNGGNNGGANEELIDDWNFIGLRVLSNNVVSVAEAGQQVKIAAFSDFVTENNTGTLKVTTNQFILTGIGYTVNDEINIKMYLNGFLLNSADSAFNYTAPPADNTIDYVRNSNDSLTFNSAIFTLPDLPVGGSAPAGPMGARINISNDTLYVTVKNSLDTTISQGGAPANLKSQNESTMRFTRQ
jgi:hypothetical protein